jgi:hypothetical protein
MIITTRKILYDEIERLQKELKEKNELIIKLIDSLIYKRRHSLLGDNNLNIEEQVQEFVKSKNKSEEVDSYLQAVEDAKENAEKEVKRLNGYDVIADTE